MIALATNCQQYNAYRIAEQMATKLEIPVDPQWSVKPERLKNAINSLLWNQAEGCYGFLIGSFGTCDSQKGLGSSYALLFGAADAGRSESVLAHNYFTPAGVPCRWPNLPRYELPDRRSFGQHIGTVWLQIQASWSEAAARAGGAEMFGHEFFNPAAHGVWNKQFVEIYHPFTGMPYGGFQENL